MNTHWIALYLAGQYPEKHISVNKIDIVLKIREIDSTNFTDFILGLQTGQSDVDYFQSLLDSFESKNGNDKLILLLERIKVPKEVREDPYSKIEPIEIIKEENKKTIGFITPFDGGTSITSEFVKGILDKKFLGWDIKASTLEPTNGKFLWSSIENFLNEYPVYIADVRNSNLNVALEIGYILGARKNKAKIIFIVDDSQKISDLQGMIRVSRKVNDSIAGESPKEASKKQKAINDKLKKEIEAQLNSYLI